MSIKLDKIQMVKASCLSFSVTNNPTEDVKGFSYEYSAQTKADTEMKFIFIQLKIDISANSDLDENKFKAGSFEFGFTYQVENLDELIEITEDRRRLDSTLHMSMLGIAFSTARGMIISRAADTILGKAYLPIVNPASLIDPNYVI